MRAHRQTALLKQKTVLPRQDRRIASSGLRFPASAATLGRVLHPADRCPNSSSLFPPLAAVVAVALEELGSRILNAHPARPFRGNRRTCAVVLPGSPGMQQQKKRSCQGRTVKLHPKINQRLENWGARRAAFRPYFLRSFIRGSRVRKPAFFSTARFSSLCCSRARLRP